MALDKTINFGKVEVSTGYDASATSIVLKTGDGAKLPATGNFNMVWWNSTDYPDPIDDPNREIVRVTARSTDTLTVTRGQESTSASTKNTAGKTYKMILGITSKMITDIDASLLPTSTAGQVLYGGAGGAWSALNIGTANQLLRVNSGATAPEWATISGGQTLYEAVVAPSGGDYTTVGAAYTAGKRTIFVRNGTYTESALTVSSANLTLIGESKHGVTLDFGSNSFSFSGNGAFTHTIENLRIKMGSGRCDWSGSANELTLLVRNVIFEKASSTGQMLTMQHRNAALVDCYFYNSASPSTSTNMVNFGDATSPNLIIGCVFAYYNGPSNLSTGTINGTNTIFNDCSFYATGSNTFTLLSVSDFTSVLNTYFYGANSFSGSNNANAIVVSGSDIVISNNYFRNLTRGIYLAGGGGFTINGNEFKNNYYGIDFNGNIATASIIANSFYLSNRAIRSSTGTSTDIIISNNNFSTSTTQDLELTSANNSKWDISNNYFVGYKISETQNIPTFNINNNNGLPNTFQRKLVRMKNTSGGSLSLGQIVVLKDVAAGDEVTTTTTAGNNKVFGMVAETIADTAYGRIMVEGKTVNLKVNGTTDIAIGDYISTYTTAGIGQKAASGETAIAIALEAYTADDSNGVIDALIISPRTV